MMVRPFNEGHKTVRKKGGSFPCTNIQKSPRYIKQIKQVSDRSHTYTFCIQMSL